MCKLSNKNQILSLQVEQEDNGDIIYITKETDSDEETNERQPKHTFTVTIMIGNNSTTTFIDTGSTTTFMTPQFSTKEICSLIPTNKLKVTVENGENLLT